MFCAESVLPSVRAIGMRISRPGGEAEIAGDGIAAPPQHSSANHGDRGFPDGLQSADVAIQGALVVQRVSASGKTWNWEMSVPATNA